MRDPWTEKTDAEGAVLEIRIEGFDAEKQDALEAEAAVERTMDIDRSLQTAPFWGRWRTSTLNLAGIFFVLGILTGLLFLRIANGLFGDDLDNTMGALLQFLAFCAGFAIPILIAARILRSRQPAALVFPTEQFTFRLDGSELTITGAKTPEQRIPLSEIVEFHGERRLSIVKPDGTTKPLAVSMLAANRHSELAERLNDALRGTRARVGGYRGPRVAQVQERQETAPSEVEDGGESVRRQRR